MINNDLMTDQYRPSRTEQKSSHTGSLDVETVLATLNSLSEGMIITDKEGKFLFFNPVATEILGIGIKNISPEKYTSVYGCYYPDKLTPYPPEKLPLALAVNGESIHDARIFIRNSEKPEGVYISVDANPIWNTQGSIIGGSVIIRDISENIKSELSLLESQERLRIQFNGFPQPTYVWQKKEDDFILIDYNHAAERFNQGSIEKHIGTKLSRMYVDSPEILADFKGCFDKKNTLYREMTYSIKKNNKSRNWIVNYVFLPPDSIMVHTEDITEKINNEKKVLKLSSAVMQTADSVLLTDKNGIIEYVNPAFEKTTGYKSAEVIGKTPALLKSGKHESIFYKNLWEIILSGNPYTGTIMNKKKDGALYWCQQSITPMKDNKGNISNFVSVIKDISELKKKQEQDFSLRIAREVQQRLSKTKFSLPGFDIAGASYSALETSGDYFDFIRTAEGHGLLVVGDVCGHGIGAALIMAETRAYIRAFAKVESDPAKILVKLNEELNSDLDENYYVTLILVRVDPARNILDYASAGHIPAYLLNSAGEIVNVLESTGIPLGFMSGEKYSQSKPIPLKSGTILTLITDGVTEALSKDENQFGHDRMINFVNRYRNDSAQQITDNLIKTVCSFTDLPYQEDDITAVVCKIN